MAFAEPLITLTEEPFGPPPAPTGFLTKVFRATEEANRRAILRALPRTGGSLLDVGCHQGDFTARVAERLGTRDVHGVELLPGHAAAAAARGIDAVVGDIEVGLPFADASFDVITANQVIEHVRATDRVLSEIRRVLRPGGVAVISTNNMASWHNVISLVLGWQPLPMHVSDEVIVGNRMNPEHGMAHEDRGRMHVRLFTGVALSDLAAHHGLETRRMSTVGYYPLPPRPAALATRLDPRHGAFLIAELGRGA